ncbi:unnamed protein product, partial [Amoebophrya sp. A120]|eukprot:GSA120T00002635001.1
MLPAKNLDKIVVQSTNAEREKANPALVEVEQTWRGQKWVAEMIPEWRVYYVSYDTFADLLTEVERDPQHATERFLQELQSAILRFVQFYVYREGVILDSLKRWTARESEAEVKAETSHVVEIAGREGGSSRVSLGASRAAGPLGWDRDETYQQADKSNSKTAPLTDIESESIVRRNIARIDRLILFAKVNTEAIRRILRKFDLLVDANEQLQKRLETVRSKKQKDHAKPGSPSSPRGVKIYSPLETDTMVALADTRAGSAYLRWHPIKLILSRAFDYSNDGEAGEPLTVKRRWSNVGKAFLGSHSFGSESNLNDPLLDNDDDDKLPPLMKLGAKMSGNKSTDLAKTLGSIPDDDLGAGNDLKNQAVTTPRSKSLWRQATGKLTSLLSRETTSKDGTGKKQKKIVIGKVISHTDRHRVVAALQGLEDSPQKQKESPSLLTVVQILDRNLVSERRSIDADAVIVDQDGGDSDAEEAGFAKSQAALALEDEEDESMWETIGAELINANTGFAIVAAAVMYECWRVEFFPLFTENADVVPTWQPYLVIWVTAIVLNLLVQGKDSDIVLVIATLFLCLCQVLDLDKAWAGFSNQVVLSVAVLGVVAQGVERAGAVEKIFIFLLGRPKGFKMATLRLMVPAIVMNIGMSNTANMSILMPILEKWSLDIGISKNMFLMPLSFILLISGTVAIFATSSNLIAQGLMIKSGQVPFTTFEIAPVAIAATVVALLCVFILMECLFPDLQSHEETGKEEEENAVQPDTPTMAQFLESPKMNTALGQPLLENGVSKSTAGENPQDDRAPGQATEAATKKIQARKQRRKDTKRYVVSVQLVSHAYVGKGLKDVDFLDGQLGCEAIAVERFGQVKDVSEPNFAFQFYDVVILYTSSLQILAIHHNPALSIITRDIGDPIQFRASENMDVCEVVLDASCALIGQRMCLNRDVRKRYGAHVLGVRPLSLTDSLRGALSVNYDPRRVRRGVLDYTVAEMGGRKYALGDTLVLFAASGFSDRHWKSNEFFGVRTVVDEEEEAAREAAERARQEQEGTKQSDDEVSMVKQIASLVILLCMVVCVSTNTLPLLTACMSAAVALTYTDCMSKEIALKAIKIRTVLTIVGAFGLGDAIGQTKVAFLLASYVTQAMAPFGAPGLLAGIFLVTVMLGIVFHATAVVILMFPVCLDSAHALNVPVHQAVCILMIGAGCQMLSPVSYQTNLMAFSAGDYSFNDFPKLGLPI